MKKPRVNSAIGRFYRLSMEERRARLAQITGVDADAFSLFAPADGLSEAQADLMVENALGVLGLPLGLCVNMQIDGEDVLVPMAVEEPSVVAACSYASKLLRAGGGVTAEVSEPLMVGQIQVLEVPDPVAAERAVLEAEPELLALADSRHKRLCGAGGGARSLTIRHLPPLPSDDPCGPMLVVHLLVDVREAMGANAINSMCERLAPRVEDLTGGRVALRILSNLSDQRTVTVVGRVPFSALDGKGTVGGETLARRIEEASVFAERDPYRACTHNKGIMNGVDATLIALGQDWRAVEAGAHAYAARGGRYTAMASWRVEDGYLVGRMTLPMAVGTVGGVAKVHPVVGVAQRIARVETAQRLAAVCAASGLAQNLGALRALAAEGIQRGHMRLHARNVAVNAGADPHEVEAVAQRIADEGRVNGAQAERALSELRRDSELPEAPLVAASHKVRPPIPDHGARFLAALSEEGLSEEGLSEEGLSEDARSAEARSEATEESPLVARSATRSGTHPAIKDERREMSGVVLVTGASGHLGANLTRRLLRDGYDVRVLLSERDGHAALEGLDLGRVQGDLNDASTVARALEGCRYVFHAAEAGSDRDASATQNLLRVARAAGVARVVVTDPPDWAGGELATLAAHEEGLDAVLVTSADLVGPSDYRPSRLGGALVDFANGRAPKLPPGGLRLLAATDVVDGHLRAMERGRSGERYVLPVEHLERDAILDIFEEVTGRPRPWRMRNGRLSRLLEHIAGAPPSERSDPAVAERAQRELGFRASGLRTAVHAAYADFARRGMVPAREGTVGDETRRRASRAAAPGARARVASRG